MDKKFVKHSLQQYIRSDIWALLEDCNAMIVGGALTSLATRKEINDIDVYFKCERDFERAVFGLIGDRDTGYSSMMNFVCATDKSMTFSTFCQKTQENITIQYIYQAFYPTLADVFDDFDFTVNMIGYDLQNDQVIMNKNTMQHLSQRLLCINPNTKFPLMSVLRISKYVDRGYTVSKKEMIKLLLKLTTLNITSYEELQKQVGGMYGTSIKQLLDVTKPFNLEDIIDQFSALDYSAYEEMKKSHQSFYDVTEGLYCKEENELDLPYLKWVQKTDEGKYHSWYQKDFEYVLGEVVTPVMQTYGYGGIWAGTDLSELAGSHEKGATLIRLEACEGTEYSGGRFKGPVKFVEVLEGVTNSREHLDWLFKNAYITDEQYQNMYVYWEQGKIYAGGLLDRLEQLAAASGEEDEKIPKPLPIPDVFS